MATVRLSLWTDRPLPLPLVEYITSGGPHPHAIVFIGGLTDTLGVVPYLAKLAERLAPLGFSLVQPQLSSSLGGYGACTIEGDAQEVSQVIHHLRTRSQEPKDNIILMGHSTGCQDVVQYLSQGSWSNAPERPASTTIRLPVSGGILQAPVSDRDDFEVNNPPDSYSYGRLQTAIRLVKAGRGGSLLEREESSESAYARNSDAVLQAPITATRFFDLYGHGGADDYFSSDLDDDRILSGLGKACQQAPILALIGAEDEYLPVKARPECAPEQLQRRWTTLIPFPSLTAHVIANANHKVDDSSAQEELCSKVVTFISRINV